MIYVIYNVRWYNLILKYRKYFYRDLKIQLYKQKSAMSVNSGFHSFPYPHTHWHPWKSSLYIISWLLTFAYAFSVAHLIFWINTLLQNM